MAISPEVRRRQRGECGRRNGTASIGFVCKVERLGKLNPDCADPVLKSFCDDKTASQMCFMKSVAPDRLNAQPEADTIIPLRKAMQFK